MAPDSTRNRPPSRKIETTAERDITAVGTHRDDVPPIGTQISLLAAEAPEAPAVTCDGRTPDPRATESISNRLARVYADRGAPGRLCDRRTTQLHRMGAGRRRGVETGRDPQPLSARLPDAEYAALLDLARRALLVGRPDPRGLVPSLPGDLDPGDVPDGPLPEAVSPALKSMAGGGAGATEADRGGHRQPVRRGGGDRHHGGGARPTPVDPGAAEPQHRLHLGDDGPGHRPAPKADATVRRPRVPAG